MVNYCLVWFVDLTFWLVLICFGIAVALLSLLIRLVFGVFIWFMFIGC